MPPETEFLAYLRGIETPRPEHSAKNGDEFLAYLRGIETTKTKTTREGKVEVPSLPTRD